MRATMQDIVREHGACYLAKFGNFAAERKILSSIERCRTPRMGGHRYRCTKCGKEELAYNSCRNRHCPLCLGSKTGEWLAQRVSELLPVPYYHCVFTLPASLRAVTLHNRVAVYNILFTAAAETLQQVARTKKHLGAEIGFFGILHTWTQTLEFHPHIHFIVPGGGLSNDTWIAKKGKRFFLPVKVLSKVFRGKFIDYLKRAERKGDIQCNDFSPVLKNACRTDWIVYCKPPFASAEAVLKYLSRYTHRVAISNARILSCTAGRVSFLARNNQAPTKPRSITLPAVEFLRRFLTHRVPHRFTRIRHFGILANQGRQRILVKLRSLLKAVIVTAAPQRPWLVCACGCVTWLAVENLRPCNSS